MLFSCPPLPCQIHATCISVEGRGLLLVGPSGSGKSALGLQLMAFGAHLVADDRCDLTGGSDGVVAARPALLPRAIEARGLGLLAAPCIEHTQLVAVLDMAEVTKERLPEMKRAQFGAHELFLLNKFEGPHFAASVFHFLKHGFHD